MLSKHFKRRLAPILMNLLIVGFSLFTLLTEDNLLATLRDRAESIIYDLRYIVITPKKVSPHEDIVIIDIDEKSLTEQGRWPWPRARLASLVAQLAQYETTVIALDIVLAEPEKNIARKIARSLEKLPDSSKAAITQVERLIPSMDGDKALADIISSSGNVLLGYYFKNSGDNIGKLGPPAPIKNVAALQGVNIISKRGYTGNLPALQSAALSAGFLNNESDDDGVSRRYSLILERGGQYYPSLALEAVRQHFFEEVLEVKSYKDLQDRYNILEGIFLNKSNFIPTHSNGTVLVPYRGYRGFRYVSASDVINRITPPEVLRNKLVFVGTSATGLSDLVTIPITKDFPGVEVHANVAAALVDQYTHKSTSGEVSSIRIFPSTPSLGDSVDFAISLVLGLLVAILFPTLNPARLIFYFLSVILLFILINIWFFDRELLILALATPLAMLCLIALVSFAHGYLFESRNRSRLKDMFGQYVPPELVDEMSDNPSGTGFEGERRELTVLFSDIRGFTSISETLNPKELKDLLNQFFTPMTEIIFNNRGTIDKYVGDMIMCFWGAPVSDPQHAINGMKAALQMVHKVEDLKQAFTRLGLPEIDVGIGLNSGNMNVGNMGSEFRRAYTVIGDEVNLGSRLESLTRFYDVDIIVGENTRQLDTDDLFVYRQLDKVTVKGKTEAVAIFELICQQDAISDSLRDELGKHLRALELYYKREWLEASEIFSGLRSQYPGTLIYEIFLDRIHQTSVDELPEDWDGVYEHKAK
ncbi:MAG: adenylate/guanylate cyclase domain-containing protein [Gammaproteobacteria bacterium]|nr:MAG: adenylate/guanylate cyclase domain-containing protein [Gammaproteobacteria bacterium]